MVKLTIDGQTVEVPEGTTVLRAAEQAGIDIPTLCDHQELTPYGGCRLCLVEVEGVRTLQPSCTLPAGQQHGGAHRHAKGSRSAQVRPDPDLQRAQPLLPLLPGIRRRLRTAKCGL